MYSESVDHGSYATARGRRRHYLCDGAAGPDCQVASAGTCLGLVQQRPPGCPQEGVGSSGRVGLIFFGEPGTVTAVFGAGRFPAFRPAGQIGRGPSGVLIRDAS